MPSDKSDSIKAGRPPLTARSLSQLPGFESKSGHVRRLPVTWGYAVAFAEYSGFLRSLQQASHELAAIWHKCDQKRNSKFKAGISSRVEWSNITHSDYSYG